MRQSVSVNATRQVYDKDMADASKTPEVIIEPSKRPRPSLEERLAGLRQIWDTKRDPLALAEASWWIFRYQQKPAAWLENALIDLRGAGRQKKHRENMQHAGRYFMVKAIHEAEGISLEEAAVPAAETLAGVGENLDSETVWQSYKKVKAYCDKHGKAEPTNEDIRYESFELQLRRRPRRRPSRRP